MPYIIGTSPQPRILDLVSGNIQSGILTTTTTNATTILSLESTQYRSMNCQVQMTEGSNYNTTTLSLFHDGTNAYITDYSSLKNNIGISTFDADISAGQFRLIAYPQSSDTTTFKFVYTAIDI